MEKQETGYHNTDDLCHDCMTSNIGVTRLEVHKCKCIMIATQKFI